MPFEHFERIAGHICFAASIAAITVVLALIWFSCCYIVSLVPMHKNINGERPRLLVAGFFRDR